MNFITPKLRLAINLTITAHNGQFRKNGDPFIVHPISVAMILSRHTDDAEIICAGLLHDVVEENYPDKSEYYKFEIRRIFGNKVYQMVMDLTCDFKKSWEERKLYTLNEYRYLSDEVLHIKSADTLDNITSLIEIAEQNDEEVISRFKKGHVEMIEMFDLRIKSIKQNYPQNPLHMELVEKLNKYRQTVKAKTLVVSEKKWVNIYFESSP